MEDWKNWFKTHKKIFMHTHETGCAPADTSMEDVYLNFEERRKAEDKEVCNWCIQHPGKNIPFSCNGMRCGKINIHVGPECECEADDGGKYCRDCGGILLR